MNEQNKNPSVVLRKHSDDISWLEWDEPESKVNVLSHKVVSELSRLMEQASKSKTQVVIFISKKPSVFVAGADLKEIQKLKTKKDFEEKIDQVHELLNSMEDNPGISFISAVHGACLGGGAELTLACDWRVASLDSSTKIGFPEVNLGLIPGFGGCVRLPRLVGLIRSLDLILTAKPVSAKKAHKLGLVDEVEGIPLQLENKALKLAQEIIQKKRPKKTKSQKNSFSLLEVFPFKNIACLLAKKQVLKKTKGFYPAPLKALAVIHKTLLWPFNKALEEEKKVFCDLAVSSISRNLIHLFFLSEKNKKQVKAVAQNPPLVQKVGVLGAGVMGSGIAYSACWNDFEVRLQDVQKESLIKGRGHIHGLLKKQVSRRKINSFEEKMKQAKVSYSLDFENFSAMDLVIEAIVEDLKVKKQVIGQLFPQLKKSAVFATNTSSLSVTEMAKACEDPSRFVGLHFFNPVHRLPLVEVIRGEKTSDQTLARAVQFALKLGKTPVIVGDRPGFLVNRLLMPLLTEALWLLGEGMDIRSVDRAFSREFGFPMGPFRLMDEVGLDVCVKVIGNFQSLGLGLSAPPFINELAKENKLGRKTSLGFYHYTDQGQARAVHSELESRFIASLDSKTFLKKEEALQRGLYCMVNEGLKVLEEKVAQEAETVDLALIMGAGFPPFRGGLLKYADSLGIENIMNQLNQWTEKGFKRFEPCPLMKTRVRQNKSFY